MLPGYLEARRAVKGISSIVYELQAGGVSFINHMFLWLVLE